MLLVRLHLVQSFDMRVNFIYFLHEFFYISVTDPENDYDEIIYSDDKISDLEKCSKFAERYDNGNKVEPFEFEIK